MSFNLGDRVEVVGYGAVMWASKEMYKKLHQEGIIKSDKPQNLIYDGETHFAYDTMPEIIGKVGMITAISMAQGEPSYQVSGIPQKLAWYNEDQLKLYKQ